MKPIQNMNRDALLPMFGCKVVDLNGKQIGRLRDLYIDPATKMVELLGVKTRRLFGHHYLIPACKASLDEAHSVIHLPYTELFINGGPCVDKEIFSTDEDIFEYYGLIQPERWRRHMRERSDLGEPSQPA